MQNFSIMNMFYCESHLHKPVKNLVFTIADFANLFLVCNFGIEVSAIGIVHDDAEASLIHE
jgi:hypothetical protein